MNYDRDLLLSSCVEEREREREKALLFRDRVDAIFPVILLLFCSYYMKNVTGAGT